MISKKNGDIICTAFANGSCHDFNLFKQSKVRVRHETVLEVDTGFLGLVKFHVNCVLPKKRSKKHPFK